MDGYHYDEKDREIKELKELLQNQNVLIEKLKNIVNLKDRYINKLLSNEDYYKQQIEKGNLSDD